MVAFTSQWQCPRVGEYIHKMQEERNQWAQEHKQDQPRPPPVTWGVVISWRVGDR